MKSFDIKVYSPNKTFLGRWDAIISRFTKEINMGLGSCNLILNKPIDYRGGELKEGNYVEILVSDNDVCGELIYSGYISGYELFVDANKEGVVVHLLGHYTKLSLDVLKNSTQTTLYTKASDGLTTVDTDISAAEVADIVKAILDRYQAESGDTTIFYDIASVFNTGNSMEYIFEMRTYREAIDKAISVAPPHWFWYIDERGKFYLNEKASTPKHTFVFGKHLGSVRIQRNIEKLRNTILFWNGETGGDKIFKMYKDDASVDQYGRRMEKYFDWSVGSEATADNMVNKIIDEAKEPEAKLICTILDNNCSDKGYDIESIQPGDTCRFSGFNESFNDLFTENMLITKVIYYPNKVEIVAEVSKASLFDWLSWLDRKADEDYSREAPEIYST